MTKIMSTAVLILLWWTPGAEAACTGSGTTWNCSAGSTTSDVQTAVNNSSDGATITFAGGSYSWTRIALSGSKGVSLICATIGACTVGGSGTLVGLPQILDNNTHLYRVSGFKFTNSSGYVIWFGYSAAASGLLTNVRIDHNTFSNMGSDGVAVFFGDTAGSYNAYGVIDHNTVTCPGSCSLIIMIGGINNAPPPAPLGTANNMFVEDNSITITTMTNTGTGCSDSWGGAAMVWRYNTSANCAVDTHGSTHAGGPQNFELYGNSISMNSGADAAIQNCYRCFHHQGSGQFVAFNNTFTAASGVSKAGNAMAMQHYRSHPNSIDGGERQCDGSVSKDGNRSPSSTNHGYPCWHQPGRDFAGNLKPMYIWNNYWSDTRGQVSLNVEDLGGSPDYFDNHMQPNREWYNAVSTSAQTSPTSPFNGTSGMGFGTLANRPTTCTTNPNEAGGGVGYFATDQNALYRCSANNTWAVYYHPYTYPHPLVSGSTPPPPAPAPAAPTNVRVVK